MPKPMHGGRSRARIAQAEVASIAQQISLWQTDRDLARLPEGFTLERLVESDEPYLRRKDLYDPWGRPYRLLIAGDGAFEVVSFGADGLLGGEGDDRDQVRRVDLASPR